MTVHECIAYVDGLEPNTYTNAQKAAWISECEGQVYTDVFLLHPFEFTPVTYDAEKDRTLAVYPPHDKLYPRYLQAMIHYANGEYDRYAASMQVFNAAWGEYVRWFSRTYDPADGSSEEQWEAKKKFRPGALLAWIKRHLTPEEIGAVPDTRKVNGNALSADVTLDAEAVAAVPTTRRVNDKELSRDISLAASDVGARPDDWMPSAADVGAAPVGRKINSKSLTSDITLDASDVGAISAAEKGASGGVAALDSGGKVPSEQLPAYPTVPGAYTSNPNMDGTASPGSSGKWSRGDHRHPSDTSRVPVSRTINGYDLTQDRTLTAGDVGALALTGTANRAKQLSAAHYFASTSGQWYKVLEIPMSVNGIRNLILTVNSAGGRYCGIVYCYFCRVSGAASTATRVRWLGIEGFSSDDLRFTAVTADGVTTFTLYLRARAGNYVYISTIRAMTSGETWDPSSYWLSTTVSEPPSTATAAMGPAAVYDGYGNGISATYAKRSDLLWFSAVTVSAGTGQQILSLSDSAITAEHVAARIEFADPAYITEGYAWATTAGKLTVTGSATAATTANILLIRKGN